MPLDVPIIDSSVPHSARIWNYWLGGKDCYEIDRLVGDQIVEANPQILDIARAQRAFLVRTVDHLVREAGIRQFLDVGTGLDCSTPACCPSPAGTRGRPGPTPRRSTTSGESAVSPEKSYAGSTPRKRRQ